MASDTKVIEMIGSIKTIYPYYAKDADKKLLVKTWCVLLKPYPDDVVEMAFFKALQKCKMPPTPADIIEQIESMQKALEPSDEELWEVYYNALAETLRMVSRFEYTYIDETGISQGQQARERVDQIWEGLPPKIKSYLASRGELIRNAQSIAYSDEIKWEKQRFIKTLPTLRKRNEYVEMHKLLANSGAIGIEPGKW